MPNTPTTETGSACAAEPARTRTRGRGTSAGGRAGALVDEASALCFWLGEGDRWGFVHLHRGRGWHVRNAKGQALTDLPDVLMVLPRPGGGPDLTVAIELKIGDDVLRPGQRDALDRYARAGAVALVVRYNRAPGEGEVDQDTAVRIIEEALRDG